MANRAMQQKLLKIRRQRRAWAKPFSHRSSVTGPNRGVLQEYKQRIAGLGIGDYELDQMIRNIYGRNPFVGVPPERVIVLQTIKELQLHVPSDRFFVLLDNCYQRVLMWFNDQQNRWFITHVDKRRNLFRRSIQYPDKATAMMWYSRGRVSWVLCETTTPTQSG